MELIPLTDFDQRFFPEITENEKVKFILHTNAFERLTLTEDQIQSSIMIQQQADPLVSGQIRCISLIEILAKNQNLIPKPEQIQVNTLASQFRWLYDLHGNLLMNLALKGEKMMNEYDYPKRSELGQYRSEEKVLGHRTMPKPENIKQLLAEAFKEYATVYHKYHDALSNPRVMEKEDWQRLERAAYRLGLRICCIKPFRDGSNRVGRLTENLLRLNCGLKFRILEDKDAFLKDVWSLQDEEYKNT